MSKERQDASSHQPPVIADGMTLGIIGAGVMGQTLIRGILASGIIGRERLWAGDKNGGTCEAAARALEIPVEVAYAARVPTADLLLLCVKPGDAGKVLATLHESGIRR